MKEEKFIPAATFHFLTPFFDKIEEFLGFGKGLREFVTKNMHIANKPLRILDAGCGTGQLAAELKKTYSMITVHGVDADPKILELGRKNKKYVYLSRAFLQDLPFQNGSFDIVYSTLVFHHLTHEQKEKAFKEIYRVLKKNGRFFLVDFGKPKRLYFPSFPCFSILFEEGADNYYGRIPSMMSRAGFKSVKKIAEYRSNIHCFFT